MLKLKLQSLDRLMRRADSLEKTPMLGKTEGGRRGRQRIKMVGWHNQLNENEFEQAPRGGEGQGSLVCCSPWDHKELDTTEWLNNTKFSSNPVFHGDIWSCLNLTFLKPWTNQCVFLMEMFFLSYVNETMYLLWNMPFFKIHVNCLMPRDDSPCSNAVSKYML